jgi:hypothetical protein
VDLLESNPEVREEDRPIRSLIGNSIRPCSAHLITFQQLCIMWSVLVDRVLSNFTVAYICCGTLHNCYNNHVMLFVVIGAIFDGVLQLRGDTTFFLAIIADTTCLCHSIK